MDPEREEGFPDPNCPHCKGNGEDPLGGHESGGPQGWVADLCPCCMVPWTWWCEHCGAQEGLRIHSSRTCYDWDGEGDDPNRALVLCDPCAKVHNEHWDEQWDEYYRNCM